MILRSSVTGGRMSMTRGRRSIRPQRWRSWRGWRAGGACSSSRSGPVGSGFHWPPAGSRSRVSRRRRRWWSDFGPNRTVIGSPWSSVTWPTYRRRGRSGSCTWSSTRCLTCPTQTARRTACATSHASWSPAARSSFECFVPDLTRYDRGQRVEALAVTEEYATIEVVRHYAVAQRVRTQKITFDSQGVRLHPVALRYCWPSELDLMAEKAGLRLHERYADWDRRPFASDSASHVSVYRLG